MAKELYIAYFERMLAVKGGSRTTAWRHVLQEFGVITAQEAWSDHKVRLYIRSIFNRHLLNYDWFMDFKQNEKKYFAKLQQEDDIELTNEQI